jgi:hypothetical protein
MGIRKSITQHDRSGSSPDVTIDAEGSALNWFLKLLAAAAKSWAEPVQVGEWWDRPAVPFHVVLAGEEGKLLAVAAQWARAGMEPVVLCSA